MVLKEVSYAYQSIYLIKNTVSNNVILFFKQMKIFVLILIIIMFQNVICSCDIKAEFPPVFSITWAFRNHIMLI